MKKVSYDTALELSRLGFLCEKCDGFYVTDPNNGIEDKNGKNMTRVGDTIGFSIPNKTIPAPSYARVFEWFREERGLHADICVIVHSLKTETRYYPKFTVIKGGLLKGYIYVKDYIENNITYEDYYDAAQHCVEDMMKFVVENNFEN